ncbi:MAG: UDP-N-acetylmuramate:L-alanyl-gamma-D-glutamyl-meso-diaminopimelate ligase [Candidatus Schekmanbacteria bacterium]|nr:UDP-N-acetylmuramate:L-alanyl-gamma-D-glutamyl-meso-diaminopimelate ligase [Candidatus Schekmanbacteria bacterium]
MKVHITAVCGSAMANLAVLLREAGHEVRGSDAGAYPPMSTYLADQGIEVRPAYAEANVLGVDLVVIGNAVGRGNPEVEAVLEQRRPFMSLPEALRHFVLAGREVIVVAGTHGKTTTTSLVAWMLECAGRAPGFLVGGLPQNFGVGARLGSGPHLVLEGDEYDAAFFDKVPKFLHYWPQRAIVTNVEFDHGDIYRDIKDVQWAFQRLFRIIPRNGCIYAGADSPYLREILPDTFCPVRTFGAGDSVDARVTDIDSTPEGVGFRLLRAAGGAWGSFFLPLSGAHNAFNASAVALLGIDLGIELEAIHHAFSTFRGVARRQQARGIFRGAPIVDDYGHHPTAVAATLAAIRKRFPGRRVLAAFEFRSNTSLSDAFRALYPRAFQDADEVLFGPLLKKRYSQGNVATGDVSPADVARETRAAGIAARACEDLDELIAHLHRSAGPDAVIVVLSSGSFGGLIERLLAADSAGGGK